MLDQKTIKAIKKIIFQYLNPQEDKVFIFGTRATEDANKFSDIDIGIESKRDISAEVMVNLKEDFEESDIPFNVDIVDFRTVSKEFRNLAKKKIIPI